MQFTQELLGSTSFKAGDYKQALIDNFFRMDQLMSEPIGKLELKKLAKLSKDEDEAQNQSEKNKKMDMFQKLLVRSQEDSHIALITGCTANVCLIDEEKNKIYFANAGDSRSILCRKGVAYAMSVDHKPELESEKYRIYKADGWVSKGRLKGNLSYWMFVNS